MKTKLLILFCFILFSISAQTTHDLDWDTNVGPSLDVAIDVGDTVRWTWTDTFNHSVFSSSSGSEGGFDSGFKQGINLTYEKTFLKVGSNPYICGVHTTTMGGTITVQTLGIEDFSLKSFKISPNPSSLNLNIELPTSITNARVEVFDVLGKQIYNKEITKTPIDITDWSRGVYLVRVSTSNATHTKRFVKQ